MFARCFAFQAVLAVIVLLSPLLPAAGLLAGHAHAAVCEHPTVTLSV